MSGVRDDLRLSAYLDGELDAEETAAVEAMRNGSAEVREEIDALRALDDELRDAFEGFGDSGPLGARVLEALPPARNGFARWRPWLLAAASLLLGVFLGRQFLDDAAEDPRDPGVGQVADGKPTPLPEAKATVDVSYGEVLLREGAAGDWKPVTPPATLTAWGASIRTGPGAQCSIDSEGIRIRLAERSIVRVVESRTVAVDAGRCFVRTSDAGDVTVRTAAGPLFCKPTAAAEVAVESDPSPKARTKHRTRVTVLDGTVHSGLLACGIDQVIEITDGRTSGPDPVSAVAATSWVHGLLPAEPGAEDEIAARTRTLIASLDDGKSKQPTPGWVQDIHSLGTVCTPQLIGVVEDRSKATSDRERQRSARVLADLAPPNFIPRMIALLEDDDPTVRRHMARGLERLTGTDLGIPSGRWVEGPPRAAHEAWTRWLDRNRAAWALQSP